MVRVVRIQTIRDAGRAGAEQARVRAASGPMGLLTVLLGLLVGAVIVVPLLLILFVVVLVLSIVAAVVGGIARLFGLGPFGRGGPFGPRTDPTHDDRRENVRVIRRGEGGPS